MLKDRIFLTGLLEGGLAVTELNFASDEAAERAQALGLLEDSVGAARLSQREGSGKGGALTVADVEAVAAVEGGPGARGSASVLDYEVPEAVIYSGRSFIQLDFGALIGYEDPQSVFRPYSLGPPSLRPQIVALTPTQGRRGTPVTVSGSGFARSETQVYFGSVLVAAENVEVTSPAQLIVCVPDGAQTAPLTVKTKHGSATSLVPFVVEADLPAPAARGDEQREGDAQPASLVTGRSVAYVAERQTVVVSDSGREVLAEDLQGQNADAVQRLRREGLPLELYRTALGTPSVRLAPPTYPNGGGSVPGGRRRRRGRVQGRRCRSASSSRRPTSNTRGRPPASRSTLPGRLRAMSPTRGDGEGRPGRQLGPGQDLRAPVVRVDHDNCERRRPDSGNDQC